MKNKLWLPLPPTSITPCTLPTYLPATSNSLHLAHLPARYLQLPALVHTYSWTCEARTDKNRKGNEKTPDNAAAQSPPLQKSPVPRTDKLELAC